MIKDIHKFPFETEEEYCARICGLKESYNLSWQDVADILNNELSCNYSSDRYRKNYYKYCNQINDEVSSIEEYILELKKEKVKVQEEKTQLNSLVRTLSREETLKEIASDVAKTISDKKILEVPTKLDINEDSSKGILVISDWHYGVDVNTYFNKYNPEIAKKRIIQLCAESIRIIYRENISELYLMNLGDMISGIIHLPLRINSRLDVISQTIQISEILAEFISQLTKCCKVNYVSVCDNHSRLDPNKKEALQPESFVRIIDWYRKERLSKNENIEFLENEFGDDICSFKIFKYKVLGVHGDKDPQKKILTQLTNFTQEHYDLVISAHRHHFYADECNETELYSNGSLMGTDDFANSLRLNNKPSQLFIVSDNDNITRNIYKIKL
jgi:hypothetical protein